MKCRYCGEEIIFIETAAGRQMPCELRRVEVWRAESGRKKMLTADGEVISCETEAIPLSFSEWAYEPHWANCPGAERARRR